jgi:transposase-like protein
VPSARAQPQPAGLLWKARFLQRVASVFQADEPRDDDQALIAELEQQDGRLTLERAILKTASMRLTGVSIRNSIVDPENWTTG